MKQACAADRLEIINCRIDAGCQDMKRDVLEGMTARQKYLPCKYFYDAQGSALFEQICCLPEYYQTRTEVSIIEAASPALMTTMREGTIIEFGSGSSRKIRMLLDAAIVSLSRIRYMPVDVCEAALRQAAGELLERYPDLFISGMLADIHSDMNRIKISGEKLFVFFGSTIGNFSSDESCNFLNNISSAMTPGDRLILGVDLIKQREVLEGAYNDAQGITALFNKNILLVVNSGLRASFDPAAFDHLAFYDERLERVEMHLRARKDLSVAIADLGMEVLLKKGETIRTETCTKFSRDKVNGMASEAGLDITGWFTDQQQWFALAEMRKA